MTSHETYMRRALQLARCGKLSASPNPMVGAVIVAPDGRIIGEGYHRRYGEAHAEVNAVNSVSAADRPLLTSSTIYVTLEPCSHFGKTPPCADLIVRTGIPHVVVATEDPFSKVAGRGIEKLKQAGIKVEVGILHEEAQLLNRHFFTAHTLRRPFVTLKWAQSADGFIDGRNGDGPQCQISSPVTQTAVHKLRASHDAILVGSGTWLADSPSLSVRHFAGKSPRRFVFDRRCRISDLPADVVRLTDENLPDALSRLYAEFGITSLLVEGGSLLLKSFLEANLYDDIIIETNSGITLADMPIKTPSPICSNA
ncbi:MAG: bifunctional diaminohydroxyphosphoribosylaminopyrimidine deaminase/5-amino-6-(5-phosphoribosylamino)uracil reductase RibD [Muribaculaceae bacterium]|nr:bifunctional diaminohydroxyphosphoribosylaminopyrimidine deaminase/5-amino-6-(5-phosphoribosylamino)uracil reductase RibD [Muribaculaceae bacterium]